MNSVWKKIASCIMVVLITWAMLAQATKLTERKASIEKHMDFFSQKEDFDVLFLGNSHTINAVFPMELWNEYGIVSYNMASHSSHMVTDYWILKNALHFTKPKLVVVDCHTIDNKYTSASDYSFNHIAFDAFPLSIDKIKAVNIIAEDAILNKDVEEGRVDSKEPRTKMGLLWDFSVYHYRWNELSNEDFFPKGNLEKGAESRIKVTQGESFKQETKDFFQGKTVNTEYLRALIELCQQEGIDILLTYYPFARASEKKAEGSK